MHSANESKSATPLYQLDDWLVDGDANLLTRGDVQRSLRNKAMELLLLFLQRPNETISREEIVARIWAGNEAVAAQGINNAIWAIRQTLDDDADEPRYLQTIPKKGYRLIAPVQVLARGQRAHAAAVVTNADEQAATFLSRNKRRIALLLSLFLLTSLLALWLLPRPSATTVPAFTETSALTQYTGMEYLGQLSPDGQLLAFAWWQSTGKGRLYLRAAADTSATPTPISSTDNEITSVAWSPDGTELAFIELDDAEHCNVMVYSLQTAALRQVGSCLPLWTPSLAWSPNAAQLVYTGKLGDSAPGLLLHDLKRGETRQLTQSDTLLSDHQPAWSADGQQIAFARAQASDASRDLYVTDLQGRVERLTEQQFRDLHGLTWRRDQDALIYSTTQHGSRTLWQFDRQRRQHQPLGLEGSAPNAHRDGLVFSLLKKHQRIALLSFAAGRADLQPLTGSVASEQSPDYSTVQQALVFVSARSGFRELWLSQRGNDVIRPLTQLRDLAHSPRWSPAGDSIAFVGSCQSREYGLCLLHVQTGKVLSLHTSPGDYETPQWSDDGQSLLVIINHHEQPQLWSVARDGSDARPLHTAQPPAIIQKRSADALLYYQPRQSRHVRAFDYHNGSEPPTPVAELPDGTVAWLMTPTGILVLRRDRVETWLRQVDASSPWQILAEFPLGTFAEFPQLSVGAEPDQVYVELADTAYADLMLAR